VPADLEAALGRLDGGASPAEAAPEPDAAPEAAEEDLDRVRDLASEAPVIRLVNRIIARAVELRASDIHLEAADAGLRLRYRIDGVLQEMEPPPAGLRAALVSRIKIMARLDIAERRLAQDGRLRLAVRGRDVDFRVSTTPSIHGESAVLRILDRDRLALDFAALGFDDALLAGWQALLARPHGILLVTGPTGSGKTTTLYASLARLNTPEAKILTVEDPVEFTLAGVNQVQVKPQIGLTFASALRSFLRQDPDVLMIGEIRDLETAQIAIQAALTGHLVLSTVHTNDAASALTRLLDMGVEDYLLTSTITGILAQRLVRRLCPQCRAPYRPGAELRATLEGVAVPADAVLYQPAGCAACEGRGFNGRTMILELLPMSDAIRPMVLRQAEAREIRAQAIAEGMQPMLAHGLRKALAGVTTVEEVFRAVRDV
jgi:general secretion pathway protein E